MRLKWAMVDVPDPTKSISELWWDNAYWPDLFQVFFKVIYEFSKRPECCALVLSRNDDKTQNVWMFGTPILLV